jgi:hypothetical protein
MYHHPAVAGAVMDQGEAGRYPTMRMRAGTLETGRDVLK